MRGRPHSIPGPTTDNMASYSYNTFDLSLLDGERRVDHNPFLSSAISPNPVLAATVEPHTAAAEIPEFENQQAFVNYCLSVTDNDLAFHAQHQPPPYPQHEEQHQPAPLPPPPPNHEESAVVITELLPPPPPLHSRCLLLLQKLKLNLKLKLKPLRPLLPSVHIPLFSMGATDGTESCLLPGRWRSSTN